MTLTTVTDMQTFLRRVTAAAKHHAVPTLPLLAPLLTAVLLYCDQDSMYTTSNHKGGYGIQLRFRFRGAIFKIKSFEHRMIRLHRVYGAAQGPALEVFFAEQDPMSVGDRFRAALHHSISHPTI